VYRFLLKPRWILSHLFVLACVIAFVNLGLWQLRRLDERKATNAEVAAAESRAPVAIDELVPAGPEASAADVDAVNYRIATVSGTYRIDQQVLVPNRTYEGSPGYWVLTPLEQADGTGVVVNRGWIPFSYTEEGPWSDFDPPTGPVTVVGMVRPPQVRDAGALVAGPRDAAEGTLRSLARVDVARLQQQVDEPLHPLYVNLEQQDPAQDGVTGPTGRPLPVPVPRPTLDEGPHFGYAMQWFTFALLTVVVYPLLLRRHARRRLQGDPNDAPTEDVGTLELSS
jgi:cytochrome oxidase assembly protein ShyY1